MCLLAIVGLAVGAPLGLIVIGFTGLWLYMAWMDYDADYNDDDYHARYRQ